MRTIAHYQKMLAENPSTTIGFTLAADMIYAARHGIIKRSDAHGSDEWKTIARNLKSRYGENLTVDDVRSEMSPAKLAAAELGKIKSPRKADTSRANGAKGGRPPKGIGVPMPFGDGQYRLSWVTDWQPENITDLGEGDVVVERHGKLYCLLTIAEARAAINRANADHKSDKAAWNATVKSMVRDRHISRAEAIDIIGPAPEWALTI